MKNDEERRTIGCFIPIMIICAIIGSLFGLYVWSPDVPMNQANGRLSITADSVSLEQRNSTIQNPNKRFHDAANNPNSTDPIRGITNSVWGDD